MSRGLIDKLKLGILVPGLAGSLYFTGCQSASDTSALGTGTRAVSALGMMNGGNPIAGLLLSFLGEGMENQGQIQAIEGQSSEGYNSQLTTKDIYDTMNLEERKEMERVVNRGKQTIDRKIRKEAFVRAYATKNTDKIIANKQKTLEFYSDPENASKFKEYQFSRSKEDTKNIVVSKKSEEYWNNMQEQDKEILVQEVGKRNQSIYLKEYLGNKSRVINEELGK